MIAKELAIIISSPTGVSKINVLLEKSRGILLDIADFALQKQPEDNSMVAISLVCKSKSSDLNYTMIQF